MNPKRKQIVAKQKIIQATKERTAARPVVSRETQRANQNGAALAKNLGFRSSEF